LGAQIGFDRNGNDEYPDRRLPGPRGSGWLSLAASADRLRARHGINRREHLGDPAYPYHFHLADEELVIVLSGRPSLRTPDGISDLEEGDAVRFPLGEEGAHQLLNRTQEVVRFLAVSNSGRPDIVVYPDSDKVRAAERLPAGDGFSASFHRGDAVDYWDGEARS
jgi:uncharacterized cupin superfamily protein